MAFVILSLFLFSGCSALRYPAAKWNLWRGSSQLVQAENSLARATTPYEKRLPVYQKSCDAYLHAYDQDFQVFDLRKMSDAIHACMLARDYDTAGVFMKFQERWAGDHPVEAAHYKSRWMDIAAKPVNPPALPPKPGDRSR